MQIQAFDDEEEKVDCSKEKSEYDQRVCAAWEAHKAKVAEHKKKYESIGQKHGLMQVRALDDDEDKVDCSKEKSDYDKRVCQAWEAHKAKVAEHKKKYESIGQKHGLVQQFAFEDDDEEKVDCSTKKTEYEQRECEAWKAHHEKVAAHKKKYESIGQKKAHNLAQMRMFY